MIHETKPNYNAIAVEQGYYDNPRFGHSCGHSKKWWELIRKAEFGDCVLCDLCNRYFAKIKNMPWVIPDKSIKNKKFTFASNAPAGGKHNHLGHGGRDFTKISDWYAVHVPVRVT